MVDLPAFPQMSLIKISFPAPIVEAAGKKTTLGVVQVFTSKVVVVAGKFMDIPFFNDRRNPLIK